MKLLDKIKLGAREVAVSEMTETDCLGEQRSGAFFPARHETMRTSRVAREPR